MKFTLIISFFLFLNFLLLLIPRLMPNYISAGQTIFWLIWANSMFLFTLVLPHETSFIFPAKKAVGILKIFKKGKQKEEKAAAAASAAASASAAAAGSTPSAPAAGSTPSAPAAGSTP